MSKLDSMIKCAQARNLLDERQFQKAVEIIDQIDTEKVRSIMDLKTIGQVYMESRHFQEAREIYLQIYDKVQSRSVLYHLIYLSIQCGLLEEAKEFYEKYKELDHDSVDCRILNYYIQKATGANHQQLISCIEKILSFEYLEEWAYELAKLYHKEGFEHECIEECGRIILWFGEGIVVEKAMLLKLHYVEGLDISSSKAIDETRNIAAELRLAARIADNRERERENYEKGLEEEQDFDAVLEDIGLDEEWQADEEPANVLLSEEDEAAEQSLQHGEETEDRGELPPTTEPDQRQQAIDDIVEEALLSREMPHFFIVNGNEQGAMEIAKQLIRSLHEKGILETPRIAKISAAKINGISLEDKKEQLSGSCLLIEGANELSLASLQTLCQIMKRMGGNLVVGFVDEEKAMKELMNRNRKLKKLIKHEIYI